MGNKIKTSRNSIETTDDLEDKENKEKNNLKIKEKENSPLNSQKISVESDINQNSIKINEENEVGGSKDNPPMLEDVKRDLGTIGNYKLLKLIGKGVYSKVFLCHENEDPSKLFAAKRISKRKIIREHILNNIYNEKNILNSLDSEFIIKLLGIEQNENKIFMFFNYYKYGDLFSYLKFFKSFSEEVTKFIIIQVYFALDYLHSKNIIYRDLKPENIIVDDDGYIKLIDLGLSKQISDENNKIFEICGTNEFIPPEVIENHNYSYNFDWWGFGILTYELLLGKCPFTGKNQKEIFKNIRKKELDFEHCGVRRSKSVFNKLLHNVGNELFKRLIIEIKIWKFTFNDFFIKQIGLKRKNSEDPISEQAKNFIELLLRKDPDERMYPNEILKHAFFKDYDYESVLNKKLESPLKNLIEGSQESLTYFDKILNSNSNLANDKNKKRRKSTLVSFDNGKNSFIEFSSFLILELFSKL